MIKIEKLNENRAFQVVLEVPRGTDYADIVTAATGFGRGFYRYRVGNYNGNVVNLGKL